MNIPLLILCGGQGLRIQGNFQGIPKALIPVKEKPLVSYIIAHYVSYGVSDVILLVGGGESYFREYVRGVNIPECNITVLQTGRDTPTGGRLAMSLPLVAESKSVFVTYGDGVSDVDIGALVKQHERSGWLATLTGVYPTLPFGLVGINADCGVVSFIEKPKMQQLTNGGFFVVSTSVLAEIGTDSDFESDVLPRLSARGELGAYLHYGFWKNMDTYKDYIELNSLPLPFPA